MVKICQCLKAAPTPCIYSYNPLINLETTYVPLKTYQFLCYKNIKFGIYTLVILAN